MPVIEFQKSYTVNAAPQKVFEVTGRPVERPGVEGHGGRVYSSPMHRDALQHELVTEAP